MGELINLEEYKRKKAEEQKSLEAAQVEELRSMLIDMMKEIDCDVTPQMFICDTSLTENEISISHIFDMEKFWTEYDKEKE